MSVSEPKLPSSVESGPEGDKLKKGTDTPESVPRTVVGVVNEKGQIIDKSGKVIGSVSEIKDHEELVGGEVTDKGDVVSDLGDSLAKVHLDDNYTPTQVTEKKEGGGGWNVMGKAKTAMQYGNNIKGAVEHAQNLHSKFAAGQKGEAETPEQEVAGKGGEVVGGAKDTAEGQKFEAEKPSQGAAAKAGEGLEGVKDSPGGREGEVKEASEGTAKKAGEGLEGAKDIAGGQKDEAEKASQEATGKAGEGLEAAKGPPGGEDANEKAGEGLEGVKGTAGGQQSGAEKASTDATDKDKVVEGVKESDTKQNQVSTPEQRESHDGPTQNDVNAETEGLKSQVDEKKHETEKGASEGKGSVEPTEGKTGKAIGEQEEPLVTQSPKPIAEGDTEEVSGTLKEGITETAKAGESVPKGSEDISSHDKAVETTKGAEGNIDDKKVDDVKSDRLESEEASIGEGKLGKAKLEEANPDDAQLDDSKPDHLKSGEAQLPEGKTGEDTLEKSKLDEGQPGEEKLDESQLGAKPGDSQLDVGKRGDTKFEGQAPEGQLGEDRLRETKLDEAKPDDTQLDADKLGETKLDESKSSDDKLGDVKPGEEQLSEGQPEKDKLDVEKLGEAKPDEGEVPEAQLEGGKLDEPQLDETKPGELPEGEVEVQSEKDKLDENKLDEAKPGDTQLGAEKVEEAKPDDELVSEGQLPEGQAESQIGEDKLDKAKIDESQPDIDKLSEEKPDEEHPSEAPLEGDKLDETKLDEAKPDEGALEETKDEAAEKAEEGVEEAGEVAEKPLDLTVLKGTRVNKAGNLVNDKGDIIGRLVDGDPKHLIGKTCDEEGQIWNESGKVIGKAEPISDKERDHAAKDFAPFENFPDATVEADGRVMSEGRQVGEVIEGDIKRMKGSRVDEDGDILDRRGNVIGKAKPWDQPEEIPEAAIDMSSLAGKRVNKAGNVVDAHGQIFGRVVEGNVKALIGRMCDKEGNIMSESGEKIGKAELVPESEREGSREGPFAELSGCTVTKDGKVITPSGDVVGRLIKGDGKVLYGRSVDEDGDVVDKNGNVLGKAERWEEPEVEKKKDPLAGRTVNREGNVVDEDGNIIGKLVSGDLAICSGKEIDDDGDVVNSKGMTIGHVSLLADIAPEPEESAEDKEKREQAEKDRKLAGQLAASIEQSLDKIKPILKLITDKVDRAERTPKEELDEEQLVREVKPLIEEGSKILTETNGVVRGMDPDGRIQRQAKHKSSTSEATPEEHHLADVIKELTGDVTQTIDNAKRKIEGMPHAKKELNPLWGLLSEPLFQIIAAVGLLLNGVLSLVGRLLSGLGLGGLVDNLLGTLGLNKLLDGLGLGSITGALTGKKDKKK